MIYGCSYCKPNFFGGLELQKTPINMILRVMQIKMFIMIQNVTKKILDLCIKATTQHKKFNDFLTLIQSMDNSIMEYTL